MEKEQIDEFCALRKGVCEAWREGPYHAKGRLLLQYLVLPAFKDPCCLDVLSFRDDRVEVWLTRWLMNQDASRFRSPVERLTHPRPLVPTIRRHQIAVEAGVVTGLLRRLQALRVSPGLASESIGLDGATYELGICGGMHRLRFSWWEQLPPEWIELQPVVDELDRWIPGEA